MLSNRSHFMINPHYCHLKSQGFGLFWRGHAVEVLLKLDQLWSEINDEVTQCLLTPDSALTLWSRVG